MLRTWIIGLVSLFVASMASGSFEVSLSKQEIASPSDHTIVTIVSNPSDEPLAIKTGVFLREIDSDGKESFDKPFEDILAVPPQMVLAPKQKAVVNLHWLKPVMPEEEIPLRVVVTQVPVDWEDTTTGGGVTFSFEMVKSLFIRPEGAFPKVELKSFRQSENSGQLTLLLENTGQSRAAIRSLGLSFDDGDVYDLPYRHILLAGSDIHAVIELPEEIKGKTFSSVSLVTVNGE